MTKEEISGIMIYYYYVCKKKIMVLSPRNKNGSRE